MDVSSKNVKQFNADMGELSLNLVGESGWRRYAAKKISAIHSLKVKKKVLFVEKTVERIEIQIRGEEAPYVIEKGVIKDDLSWVKDVLKTFAEKNKVQFIEQ